MRGSETEAETKEREGRRVFVPAVPFCLITFRSQMLSVTFSTMSYPMLPKYSSMTFLERKVVMGTFQTCPAEAMNIRS